MCLICNSTEQTVTQIVMRGKRVGIVETCGKKLAQKKNELTFSLFQKRISIFTLWLVPMGKIQSWIWPRWTLMGNVWVFVCVWAQVWVEVSSSMDVLSLAALLLTHCSLMFTQLFSAAIFSVEYLKYEACLQECIMCMFKCNIHKTVPVHHTWITKHYASALCVVPAQAC